MICPVSSCNLPMMPYCALLQMVEVFVFCQGVVHYVLSIYNYGYVCVLLLLCTVVC